MFSHLDRLDEQLRQVARADVRPEVALVASPALAPSPVGPFGKKWAATIGRGAPIRTWTLLSFRPCAPVAYRNPSPSYASFAQP